MPTTQRGLIVADDDAHKIISGWAHKAYTVASWQNGRAPKTQDQLYAALKANGYMAESVFDAGHGRRYMLFVYKDRASRKACWDCITGSK